MSMESSMESSVDNVYFLMKTAGEAKRNLGYHVHPVIKATLPPSPRVADVGTGSGIYLLEVAAQLPPTSRLDGFDVSSRHFPADPPSNVSFHLHDARTAFPEELRGQYDFVHLRLLVAAMEAHDWSVVAANVIQLLKPGGAVQWAEPDIMAGVICRGADVAVPGTTMNLASNHFKAALGFRFRHGFADLSTIFGGLGLDRVFQDVVVSDLHADTRAALSAVTFDGVFRFARKMAGQDVPRSWKMTDIDTKEEEVVREIAAGCYNRYDLYVTVGFVGAS